jgi:hypothetical protein
MFNKDLKLTIIFFIISMFLCRIVFLLSSNLIDISLFLIFCSFIISKYKIFYKKFSRFEGDYLVFPKNVEFSWLNVSINRFLNFFGMENFEIIVGTVLRGDKSGNYRDEQYGKKIISEDIINEINNNVRITHEEKTQIIYEFLQNVNYKKLIFNDLHVKFTLHLYDKHLSSFLKNLSKYKFISVGEDKIQGEFLLPEDFNNQVFYGIFFENEGVRITNDEAHLEAYTKCPIISYEYSMVYYINITCQDLIENNLEFKKNLFTSIIQFYNFTLEILKEKNNMPLLKKILKNDLNALNENSVGLYMEFEKSLINVNKKNPPNNLTIEEITNLIFKIGNNFQEIIMYFNSSDNVFKHFNVPFFIQKTIIDYNYFHKKNKEIFQLPNLKFNFPYISNDFWGILDLHDLHQNLQIALDKFHMLNIWIVHSEEEANFVSKKMLDILEKYISKKQFVYLNNNFKIKKYVY